MEEDVRKDWFMNQHFTKEQLYGWEKISGKVAEVVKTPEGFFLHHIEDLEKKIDLCFMKEEYMLRRWTERLGYKTKDGKTSKQFEEENGIKDPPVIVGEEIFRKDRTSISKFGDKKFTIVSGDYAIVANRTASNSYEILLLDNKEYVEYLEKKSKENSK